METSWFESFDCVRLAVHAEGEGRPAVLLHGFMANAGANWFATGTAAALVAAGRRVIAPDLRGHGQSDAPVDPAAWPADVLAADLAALVDRLQLADYDLAGYSLGARTAVRGMARGLRPGRAVLGGLGDTGVMGAGQRTSRFEDAILNGEKAEDSRNGRRVRLLIAYAGLEPRAMLGVLRAFQPTTEAELRAIATPSLVVCGREDLDHGSPQRLAELLGDGECVLVPGDHNSAVARPELAAAIAGFLTR